MILPLKNFSEIRTRVWCVWCSWCSGQNFMFDSWWEFQMRLKLNLKCSPNLCRSIENANVNSKDKFSTVTVSPKRCGWRCKRSTLSFLRCDVEFATQEMRRDSRCCIFLYSMGILRIFKSFLHKSFYILANAKCSYISVEGVFWIFYNFIKRKKSQSEITQAFKSQKKICKYFEPPMFLSPVDIII